FIGKNGNIIEVVVSKMKLGEPDVTGRQKPEIISGSEIKIKADMVIKALGFDPEDIPTMFSEPKLDVSKWGTIKIDLKTMQTNIEGVFAAGDIVRGASLVVWAIKDGRDAAEAIDVFLKNKAFKSIKKRMVA
ncbi:MAG: hypothetical protein RL765_67, partial [Pseudomonadota bacterium]